MISARGLRPLRWLGVWLGIGCIALVLGVGLSLAPLTAPPPIPGEDKTLHVGGFLLLMLWFAGIVEQRLLWQVAGLLGVYGLLVELLQSFTAYRAAELYDVLANIAGIGAGWLLAAAGLRHWARRIETLLGVDAATNGPR